MHTAIQNHSTIDSHFYRFITDEVLPLTPLNANAFWRGLEDLISESTVRNRALLARRDSLQRQIDQWHKQRAAQPHDAVAYQRFLEEIGYILPEPGPVSVDTTNVDDEIATIAGPQLVVPLKNARFAVNAVNARWGSLYDALYGTDVINNTGELAPGQGYNPLRGAAVIRYARDFLDSVFPLVKGSHRDAVHYRIHDQQLFVVFDDDSQTSLRDVEQLIGLTGSRNEPTSLILKNNGLHVEIEFDRESTIGASDGAGIKDIKIESALTTIMDCEDSVAAVDAEDKTEIYRNWLGLIKGDLSAAFDKGGKTLRRCMNADRNIIRPDGSLLQLHGRSLMLIRNVGLLMSSNLMRDAHNDEVPEGIIDAVVTSLIASLDLRGKTALRNSRCGSIYIVKPKLHGPAEVAFTVELFDKIEDLLGLPRNTIKLGIMDEERRTTVNLKACIAAARTRTVFINTGFLDRTGDEIHTSMYAGAFLPKAQIKDQPGIRAYEDWNVDTGLACNLPGRAQIGKGMWPKPDEMAEMMATKINHPKAGATTAWVPSPTAATLHALHYHQVDVFAVQEQLRGRPRASIKDILTIPLITQTLDQDTIVKELENNIQGILGYVVRWVEQGIGCSKVPDINHVGLMEDRATLRISSQHIANWLLHGICTKEQVLTIMHRMARVVDEQNRDDSDYRPMSQNINQSLAFQAAKALIFEGQSQPNGYTEPLLHHFRQMAKSRI
ncbi:MAG: malate synthase G [Pseudohongiella sp.]|nr:malate synthase G [Pseudohongiella sp.]